MAWPALAGNPTVTAPTPVNAIRMVLDGGFAPATAANPRPHGMPPFAPVLGDNDVAALVSYIRSSWGNQAGRVTPFEVKRVRDASTQIGRASCRGECVSACRSRWSPYH